MTPMRIDRFTCADVGPFLSLAEKEGWLCERWEFDFLLQQFPQGCLACRQDGDCLGYVTSVSYGLSGWIGNLIVHPSARRRGIGRQLLEAARSALLDSGVQTVWLTASQQGAGLYRQLGFVELDRINRWQGVAGIRSDREPASVPLEFLQEVDGSGWGAPRDALLLATAAHGRVHACHGGFLCCQQWEKGTQIGPWGSLEGGDARLLLDTVLTVGDTHVFMDVPAGNIAAASLLCKRGLSIVGSSVLMYFGETPAYRPGSIFALASMGSSG